MKLSRLIKDGLFNAKDNFIGYYKHRVEFQKFKDVRRQEIAKQYPLNKEQKEQIDAFFLDNYGKKVDYVWHQNYAAHANRFDYKFIPEPLFIPEFERYQNRISAANEIMSDKNFLPNIAKVAGVRMPQTIVSCTNGVLRDGDNRIISSSMCSEILHKNPVFFVKPTTGSDSGQGCRLVTEEDSFDIEHESLIINEINKSGYSQNYVCQEVINTHKTVSDLHPESVNTFRIITYFWKDVIENMPVIMRIGKGKSNVDNAHAGGMFIAVYPDGRLGDHAVTEFNVQYKTHPNSGIMFSNHKIVSYNEMINAAKRMHEMVPQIGVVNWDFTVGENGDPILIEANVVEGSIWLPQMAHGVGAFGNKTEEVLQWLRFMNKQKPSVRKQYFAGNMQ